jgi:hypothetical protein
MDMKMDAKGIFQTFRLFSCGQLYPPHLLWLKIITKISDLCWLIRDLIQEGGWVPQLQTISQGRQTP